MRPRIAAVFCMPERGHLQRLLPLIAGLARAGVSVVVFTAAEFTSIVGRAGGRFVDLFTRYPLEAADATSRPVPCRYVSFAAHYADALIDEMRVLRPSLIVYDTFAVIGPLLGRALGIPYINACAGHNMSPARAVRSLEGDPRVLPSDQCRRAVDVLRDRWGVTDASPFSYFTGLSPYLNVYGEPPAFLRPEEAEAFQPIAFFGSVAPPDLIGGESRRPVPSSLWRNGARLRVYASFGSVVWRYFEAAAVRALASLSDAIARTDSARAVISLGGHRLGADARARLERHNVQVADYVDQWAILRGATVCVTHQGLNSTHEMIYHRVPMISYPFFADQPALAARCQEFGLAVPLAGMPRGPVAAHDVRAALGRVRDESARMAAGLDRARAWELETMAGRQAVIEQMLSLRPG
ncbi:MAG: glycosyltransferase [Armatimonadota bacterium]|nr:glycosyltransferase [Armatimonadota bacterium]